MKALITLLLSVTILFAAAPTVENVSFNQRTDGSLVVDIYYDLSDNDAETKKIVVEASADNGSTWNLVCSSLTGDVGDNVAQGTGKHIVWDFYVDNPNLDGDQFKIRVTALETGTMTDYDGNTYQTIKIGDQWWMAENLKVTHYKNGQPIATNINDRDWVTLDFGAFAYYDHDPANGTEYGCLYNWYAVTDEYGLAPSGWHVPTDAEWTTLETTLGGSSVAGGKLKEIGTSYWASPNGGATNESGFTALPAGYRNNRTAVFWNKGEVASFWSSTSYDSENAWYREIYWLDARLLHSWEQEGTKKRGSSVRLIKD